MANKINHKITCKSCGKEVEFKLHGIMNSKKPNELEAAITGIENFQRCPNCGDTITVYGGIFVDEEQKKISINEDFKNIMHIKLNRSGLQSIFDFDISDFEIICSVEAYDFINVNNIIEAKYDVRVINAFIYDLYKKLLDENKATMKRIHPSFRYLGTHSIVDIVVLTDKDELLNSTVEINDQKYSELIDQYEEFLQYDSFLFDFLYLEKLEKFKERDDYDFNILFVEGDELVKSNETDLVNKKITFNKNLSDEEEAIIGVGTVYGELKTSNKMFPRNSNELYKMLEIINVKLEARDGVVETNEEFICALIDGLNRYNLTDKQIELLANSIVPIVVYEDLTTPAVIRNGNPTLCLFSSTKEAQAFQEKPKVISFVNYLQLLIYNMNVSEYVLIDPASNTNALYTVGDVIHLLKRIVLRSELVNKFFNSFSKKEKKYFPLLEKDLLRKCGTNDKSVFLKSDFDTEAFSRDFESAKKRAKKFMDKHLFVKY